METIFDHNVTSIEIELLNSFIPSRVIRNKENYIGKVDGDKSYADIYHLYILRGDIAKADNYAGKIKNPKYKCILSSF